MQPSHRRDELWRTNVVGTGRVLDAIARLRVPALVYSSSVDPTIGQLLADIRASTSAGQITNLDANIDEFRYNVPVQSKRRFPTARVDYNITDNHKFSSAWNYNWFTDAPDTLSRRFGWLVLRPASRMNCRSPYDPSHGNS